jgi:hypothetical protein
MPMDNGRVQGAPSNLPLPARVFRGRFHRIGVGPIAVEAAGREEGRS